MIGRPGRGSLATVLVVAAFVVAACVPAAELPTTPATEAPSPTPSASASPSFIRPTPNPSPTFVVYEVRTGDTLTSIARDFGTTARSIAYWNRGRYPSLDPDSPGYEPDRIEAGWTLELIPTAVVDEDELPEPTPRPTPAPTSSATAAPPAGEGSPLTNPSPGPS